MNNPKKKSASKASHKRKVKDLEIKPAKGGTVRGGKVFPKVTTGLLDKY